MVTWTRVEVLEVVRVHTGSILKTESIDFMTHFIRSMKERIESKLTPEYLTLIIGRRQFA